MSKSQTVTIERPAAELIAEARERLALAQAAVNRAATVYNQRGTAGDGVALREARATFEKAQNECAVLEDRAVAEADAARETVRRIAKGKIAKLTARREELAASVDGLTEQLVTTLREWLDVDDAIYAAFPGSKTRIPAQLGRSRILGLLRETQNRAGAGLIANDVSRSQMGSLRKAACVVKDDNSQIMGAL